MSLTLRSVYNSISEAWCNRTFIKYSIGLQPTSFRKRRKKLRRDIMFIDIADGVTDQKPHPLFRNFITA